MRPGTHPSGLGRYQRQTSSFCQSESALEKNPRAHRRAAYLLERRRSRRAGTRSGQRRSFPALDYGFVLSRTVEDDAEDHRQTFERDRRPVQIRSRRRGRLLLAAWLGTDRSEGYVKNRYKTQAPAIASSTIRTFARKERPRRKSAMV